MHVDTKEGAGADPHDIMFAVFRQVGTTVGVEGRRQTSKAIGGRLTAYLAPRVASGVLAPLLPPERYLSQEALHLSAFADWEGVLALDAPPERADFSTAVYHYARS